MLTGLYLNFITNVLHSTILISHSWSSFPSLPLSTSYPSYNPPCLFPVSIIIFYSFLLLLPFHFLNFVPLVTILLLTLLPALIPPGIKVSRQFRSDEGSGVTPKVITLLTLYSSTVHQKNKRRRRRRKL